MFKYKINKILKFWVKIFNYNMINLIFKVKSKIKIDINKLKIYK